MKIPCCTVCQNRYNEEERCPLLLQCGHGFCKDCLFRMFEASSDSSLSCPRCRHVSIVGNSVHALRKNYAILGLLNSSSSSPTDFTDDDDDDEGSNDNGFDYDLDRRRRSAASSSTGCAGGTGGGLIELALHPDLRLIRRFGEGGERKVVGVEMWTAFLSGRSGKCRHGVAVKKLVIGEDTDLVWVQNQLENLRRASMWCTNVCTFHGATKMDGCLFLVMDRCTVSLQTVSLQTEMQRC